MKIGMNKKRESGVLKREGTHRHRVYNSITEIKREKKSSKAMTKLKSILKSILKYAFLKRRLLKSILKAETLLYQQRSV